MKTIKQSLDALRVHHFPIESGSMDGRCAIDAAPWPCEIGKIIIAAAEEDQLGDLFDEVRELIEVDRQADYGNAEKSFARIAVFWSEIFGVSVSAHQVALAMMALKLSRVLGAPKHDTSVDLVAYAVLAERLDQR
jgi:hypothetical protein